MDRASCCVWSSIGPYRTCKPLGSLLAQCNARSHQYPYIGSREGYSCPCGGELECFTEPERRGERRRGRCAFWRKISSSLTFKWLISANMIAIHQFDETYLGRPKLAVVSEKLFVWKQTFFALVLLHSHIDCNYAIELLLLFVYLLFIAF